MCADPQSKLDAYAAATRSASRSADFRDRMARWSMYAAAAGAALASATSGEAGNIVYGFSGKIIGVNGFHQTASTGVTIGSIGKLRMGIRCSHPLEESPFEAVFLTGRVLVHSADANHFRPFLLNLNTGAEIGPSRGTMRTFIHPSGFFSTGQLARLYPAGVEIGTFQFLEGVTGIAGFRGGNGDYGWIKLRWEESPGPAPYYPESFEALNWAIDTTPNQAIEAGVTPEPGTLPMALLASVPLAS